eukprot:356902-Chlamydomonas_euryale.AAC.8
MLLVRRSMNAPHRLRRRADACRPFSTSPSVASASWLRRIGISYAFLNIESSPSKPGTHSENRVKNSIYKTGNSVFS